MRIALLTDGLFPYKIGGIQKHSLFLARYLAEEGAEVTVFFSYNPGQELVPSPTALSGTGEIRRLHFVPVMSPGAFYFPGHFIWESFRISKRFYTSLKGLGPFDFIFAQGFAGWYSTYSRSRGKLSCPVGVHPHGLEMFQEPDSLRTSIQQIFLRFAMRRNLALADAVFALGYGMKGIMERSVFHSKIYLAPNGIGSDWIQSTNPDKEQNGLHFLFVGRYERRKGLPELSRVIVRILKERTDFTFHFVGPVPSQYQIESPSVRYWGEIREESKLKQVFTSCDVLVCPSHSEGMPTVILEGMASGLAILATHVGAVPDMVSEANGWLIPPMSEATLEVAIKEILTCDPAILQRKKEASQSKVQHSFLWNAVAKTTLEEIQKAISESSLRE